MLSRAEYAFYLLLRCGKTMKRISAYPLREEHSPNVELDNFIDGISGT